jgi:release factor glutamine methyltransferase
VVAGMGVAGMGVAGMGVAGMGVAEARPLRAADVGTGAGVIGLTLAAEHFSLVVWCTDLERAALELTARNAAALGVTERVHRVTADLVRGLAEGSLDLVVSNPPYIAHGAIANLDPEVRDHDPHSALDGGADGLDLIGRLLDEARTVLRPGGYLVLEIGDDQGAAVHRMARGQGWESVAILPDLGGRDRVLRARRVL